MKSRPPRAHLAIALASLRVPQWLHFCALPLAGVTGLSGLGCDPQLTGPAQGLRVLAGCLIAAGCLGCAYGINAVAERHTDLCAGKNPLVTAPEGATLATACALLASLLALLLALFLGPWALLACGTSLGCGLAYSVGGKRVPVLGLLLNTGIFAPLMAVLLVPGATPPSWAHELAVFTLLLLQNQLIHELADEAEDRAAGARTTAQLLRRRGTVRVAILAGLAIPPASLALAPNLAHALLGSALAAVATVIVCDGRDPARARVAHRVAACVGGALLWLLARIG